MPDFGDFDRGECPNCRKSRRVSVWCYVLGRGYLMTWECVGCDWRTVV